MTADDVDEGCRAHLDVLKETIDRNKVPDWDRYREKFAFTILSDGAVRVSMVEEAQSDAHPLKTEGDHVVTLDGGKPVDCDCHIAQRRFGHKACRHMRAVETHPHL